MFRLRRYRVFIIFAIIVVGLFYHFRSIGDIQNAGAVSVEGLKHFGQKVELAASKSKDTSAGDANDRFNSPVAETSLVDSGSVVPTTSSTNAKPKDSKGSDSPKSSQESKGKYPQGNDAGRSNPPLNPAKGGNRTEPKVGGTPESTKINPPGRPSSDKPSPVDKSLEDPADPAFGGEGGKGRLEVIEDTTIPKIHWSQLPEHFPVPTESLIKLPTGKPIAIPAIQHDFGATKKDTRLVQQDKLDAIKKTFSFSWSGYREKAWMQDELSPKSGKYRNPFCGWGATLVDSLDTLWLMNLKEDFDEALEAVKEIDFTTSMRNDIPLFETVIRYLGGLIGAYDISGGTHRILLDKAVELAEILMGAFDTPNRMPMTFYLWKPTFASQPHRAKTRVVLAELGTLSLEFTRLAQITKENKYYDAIARITNEFELWQNQTKLPGLWPLKVDASGCKKTARNPPTLSQSTDKDSKTEKSLSLPEKAAANRAAAANPNIMDVETGSESDDALERSPADVDSDQEPLLKDQKVDSSSSRSASSDDAVAAKGSTLSSPAKAGVHKRDDTVDSGERPRLRSSETTQGKSECEAQGLASPSFSTTEEFGLGGLADSTYEYLPKEYLLLGGVEPKYRSMYEMAADASKKHLIYRPMIADEKRSILQAGLVRSTGKETSIHSPNFQPEGTHLTCFVGGMFAVGAKIFDRKDDLDIANKLTDGCIWAYEATTTGIMPESYLSIPCKQTDSCPWNETLWRDKLDPYGSQREKQRIKQQDSQLPIVGAGPKAKSTESVAGQAGSSKAVDKNDSLEKTPTLNGLEDGESELGKVAIKGSQAKEMPGLKDSSSQLQMEGKTLEDKLFQEQDNPEEVPLPKHGQSNPRPTSEMAPPKEPLKKRQLGEVEENPLAPEARSSNADAVQSKALLDEETINETTLEDSSTKKPQPGESSSIDHTIGKASDVSHESDSVSFGDSKSSQSLSKPAGQNVDESSTKVSDEATAGKPPARKADTTEPATQTSGDGIPTREEFIGAKIKDERLPLGITKVTGSRYLLRPEAIESVFIMYRITGDDYWRKHGWEMFKAIERNTNSTYGAAAISDVTKENPKRLDEMESFWLAETLKYFYLLFSDPSVVSLDDYVLNTEAHPFKRPTNP